FRVAAAAVLQNEFEAASRAQAADWRRIQHQRIGILDFAVDARAERAQDFRATLSLLVARAPRLETDERRRVVRRRQPGEQIESDQRRRAVDAWYLVRDPVDFVHRCIGALERRAG